MFLLEAVSWQELSEPVSSFDTYHDRLAYVYFQSCLTYRYLNFSPYELTLSLLFVKQGLEKHQNNNSIGLLILILASYIRNTV